MCEVSSHETAETLLQVANYCDIRYHTVKNKFVILKQFILTTPCAQKNKWKLHAEHTIVVHHICQMSWMDMAKTKKTYTQHCAVHILFHLIKRKY